MGARLLVTGARGFLGTWIVEHFASGGWAVLAIDRTPGGENSDRVRHLAADLSKDDLKGLVEEFRPTGCAHCAGRSSVPQSITDPEEDFVAGPALTSRLLGALRQSAPDCRTVLLSSAAVYGNPVDLPVRESALPAPISPYGWHKWQSELLLREYQRVYDMPTASVRIFSAYGPGLERQVVWDICRKALQLGELRLQGTGRESRDFIHALDVAGAVEAVIEQAPMKGEVYNLANGRQTTIAELAGLALEALGLGIEPLFDGRLPAGVPALWHADISAISRLGFQPEISLAEGVAQVAEAARRRLVESGSLVE